MSRRHIAREAKRIDTCAICGHRDTHRHHGASHCKGNFLRQHPTCTHDGRKPRFVPDLAAIRSITERQLHAS